MDKKVASNYTYEISPAFYICKVDTRNKKTPNLCLVLKYSHYQQSISLGSMALVNKGEYESNSKGEYECNSSPLPPIKTWKNVCLKYYYPSFNFQ